MKLAVVAVAMCCLYSVCGNEQPPAAMVSDYNCEEAKGKRILVIVFGLMRSFEDGWPNVAKQLQLSEWEACEGKVDVMVQTELSARCSPKDAEKDRPCGTGSDATPEKLAQTIRKVYGEHRLLKVIDSAEHKNLERITHAFSQLDQVENYQFQVIIRADATLTWNKINLIEVCKEYYGGNIISGSYTRPCHGSNRDWDFGFLGCGVKATQMMFQETKKCNDIWPGCKGSSKSPPELRDVTHDNSELSKGCDGPWGCDHSICDWTARLQLGNFPPMATLDKIELFATIPQPAASKTSMFSNPSVQKYPWKYPQQANSGMGYPWYSQGINQATKQQKANSGMGYPWYSQGINQATKQQKANSGMGYSGYSQGINQAIMQQAFMMGRMIGLPPPFLAAPYNM